MMFKKVKSLLSLLICISVLCTVMPITSYAADAAENVASVTFNGNTEYYTTIDDAWNAAVALDTTAENKATIKLLADCTSNSMLNLVYDYFILDTNNKTLTGTSKLEYSNYVYSVIYVDGGSLEIIGNGTITGYTKSDYTKGILIVNNGVAYIDGVTVHNTGTGGAYGVVVRNGGDFYLLDGHIISDGEYALSAGTWDVYLYSGKIESSGRRAMTVKSRFHICYSDKPIYLINNDVKNKDNIIYSSDSIDYIMLLDDHVGVDLEYSQNPDGSNPTSLKNVKKLSYTINHNTSYLKIQTFRQNTITVNATEGGTASSSSTDVRIGESVTLTATADEGYTFDGWYDGDTKVCDTAEFVVDNVTADKTYTAKFTKNLLPESKLFSVSTGDSSLIRKIKRDGITDIASTGITAVHFVDLADYDLTNISYSDYSARGDGSVKAWMDGTELYIGGYGKIIAGKSLAFAFMNGFKIDKITGLEMLDTSNVTDMSYMFYSCGRYSQVFTLDLGNNFDTSNVTNMSYMFYSCGNESAVFTLDLGEKFDTSNVTDMHYMFSSCGVCSQVFTLDLGDKFNTSKVTDMKEMFRSCGSASKLFTLNLGDKFDTSNVADMRLMFHGCGIQSSAFTTLDLSKFTVGANTKLDEFAYGSNVKTFIFGDGWANASLPSAGSEKGAFYADSQISTTVIGATENLCNYDWASDNRIVNGLKPQTYTVTANAETGGTVAGGGEVAEGESITLTAAANDGYTFAGWYDGDTKVCETAEFVVSNVTEDKTYTAKFAKNAVSYTITAEAGTEGGTVSGGGEVADGGNITLTATANEGYTFDGWYDGDTKVCDTTEFVVENITTDKTYTAKFTKDLPKESYLINIGSGTTLFKKIKRDGVTNIDSNEITAVHFVDLADYDLTNIPYSDYSASGDDSVKAWMNGTELYIGGYGKIIAGKSLAFAFMNGVKIDKITGLEMLDTSNVTDMKYMFYACGMYSQVLTLDLGNNFDTSNVTKMGSMFYSCGNDSTAFTLNLGDKFDTSNVTDMSSMFTACGGKSNVFTLDLGNKFDTSKVTNMKEMFRYCGSSAKSFTLNLGDKFDTSNVTDMGLMFHSCGSTSTAFTLDLGNKFDTSNVTDMNFMFGFCGCNSSVFNLDLGDKFNTSKAANMEGMFYSCGYKSSAFTTLDLSKFTIGANTKLDKFAYGSNVKTFIFGNGWANAVLPSAGSSNGAFYASPPIDTQVIGATENLCEYDWASDNRIVNGLKPQTYTVTANAETGGTVSGGSEVTEGESVTLTATANDGYTFAGWYDGDTKVCDTAEFVVTNVTANKTYTAKFTKNQIVEPDPEPEEPEIPYLKWDGSTLTLVKKASAKCRVGIVYVGGATFDTNNINWDELVAAGKDYANLNSPVGYAIYGNFTKRTPGTRGNYVAFVKYTKEDGTTTADYITFNVKNAVSFERPSLSYNPKTRTLKMKGNVSSTIGVAYIGESEVDASNITWNDFVKVGKLYPDENGSSGYTKVLNTLDYTKTFNTNGNYVAFIKYFDGNLNKSLAKYYTFTVDDYNLQPTDIPFALAEESQIILNTNGFDVAKVTIVYIGTDDVSITNWNEFSAAAAKFSDINGKELNQQYTNPKDGSVWKQKTAGWYGVYIRYNIDGERCNSYYTVEVK